MNIPNLTLQEAKDCVGPGWHFLVEMLYDFAKMKQSHWLKTKEGRFQKPEKELFTFEVQQVKEKWGRYRCYSDCRKIEHDWTVFDEEDYDNRLVEIQDEIYGFIQALENFSGFICEDCGQRGEMKKILGLMRTLCEKCCSKSIDEKIGRFENKEIKALAAELVRESRGMTSEEEKIAAESFWEEFKEKS